jgi:hypothetical protein
MMLRRPTLLLVGIAVISTGLLIGCDLQHAAGQVDNQRYAVPKTNLVTSEIPWLPSSQRNGLMFVLNPSDRPQQQVIILLEDNDQACVGRSGVAYMRSLCDPTGNARFDGAESDSVIMRVPSPPNDFITLYVRRDHPAVFLADCVVAASAGIDGLCHSVGAYRDTHFSISFPERSIHDLPKFVALTDQLLHSWEVKGTS